MKNASVVDSAGWTPWPGMRDVFHTQHFAENGVLHYTDCAPTTSSQTHRTRMPGDPLVGGMCSAGRRAVVAENFAVDKAF
eukprot:2218502-Prymnesium_polylepis.1